MEAECRPGRGIYGIIFYYLAFRRKISLKTLFLLLKRCIFLLKYIENKIYFRGTESDKTRQKILQLMISVLAEEELIQQIENYVCPKFQVTGFLF